MGRVRSKGEFVMYHRDAAGRLVWILKFPNGTTIEGVNYLLDGAFRGGSRGSTWYIGLIDNSGFAAVADTDTLAAHSGWSEYTGLYASNRGSWTPIAANAGLMAYSPITTIQIASSGNIIGAFLANQQPVGATTGVLYATGVASSALPVTAGGTVSVGYKTKLVG